MNEAVPDICTSFLSQLEGSPLIEMKYNAFRRLQNAPSSTLPWTRVWAALSYTIIIFNTSSCACVAIMQADLIDEEAMKSNCSGFPGMWPQMKRSQWRSNSRQRRTAMMSTACGAGEQQNVSADQVTLSCVAFRGKQTATRSGGFTLSKPGESGHHSAVRLRSRPLCPLSVYSTPLEIEFCCPRNALHSASAAN